MIITNEQELEDLIRRIFKEELAIGLRKKKERLLTVSEAVQELRISRSTLSRLTKEGKIKCSMVTGRPMYLEAEIEEIKAFGIRNLR